MEDTKMPAKPKPAGSSSSSSPCIIAVGSGVNLDQARQQLKEAIDVMPETDKRDYVEAMKLAPHLVETESDPVRFLRFEKFNAWAAAQRLVAYWKARTEIFGERAFLSMDLSGTGAMDRKRSSL